MSFKIKSIGCWVVGVDSMVWQVKWLGLWLVLCTTATVAYDIADDPDSELCSHISNDINKESSNNRSSNTATILHTESSKANESSYHSLQQDFLQYEQNDSAHRIVKCKQSKIDLSVFYFNTFSYEMFWYYNK